MYDHEVLGRAIKSLGLKFPVAKISKELDYNKGTISQYINGKQEMSENFVRQFEEHFQIKLSDFAIDESLFTQYEKKDIERVIKKFEDISIDELITFLTLKHESLMDSVRYKKYINRVAHDRLKEIINDYKGY